MILAIQLSDRIQSIKPSPTLAVTNKAAELKAAGQDIIALGAGEPDFATPEHVNEAAKIAIDEGFTRYTAVDGIKELKQAVIAKFAQDNQLNYQPEQILVSCGAKHSIYNLLQSLLNQGDEVIIPAPYWTSYLDMVILTGAKPVVVYAGMDARFKVTAEQIRRVITAKTKLIMLNSPSNPTGVLYSKDELLALAQVLLEHPQIIIMSDDIYEHTTWSTQGFYNIAMVCPELISRTVVVNGVSKAYAMTGWRIGYAAGPVELIKAMSKLQGQSTSNPCSIAQKAAIAALTGDQSCITTMTTAFKERHDYVVSALRTIPGIECLDADGAFYVFFKVDTVIKQLHLSGIQDDVQFAEYLLHKVGVALVPGAAFGAPGFLRASIATSMGDLQEAMRRLSSACNAAI